MRVGQAVGQTDRQTEEDTSVPDGTSVSFSMRRCWQAGRLLVQPLQASAVMDVEELMCGAPCCPLEGGISQDQDQDGGSPEEQSALAPGLHGSVRVLGPLVRQITARLEFVLVLPLRECPAAVLTSQRGDRTHPHREHQADVSPYNPEHGGDTATSSLSQSGTITAQKEAASTQIQMVTKPTPVNKGPGFQSSSREAA